MSVSKLGIQRCLGKEDVLPWALLVGAAQDELELVGRHTNGLEDCCDAELIVLGSVVDKFDGGLEVVEEPVTIDGLALLR